MKRFLSSLSIALTLLTSAASATEINDRGGRGGRGGGGGGRNTPRNWICTATANDSSGLFFLGMGRSYGDAYARASETCHRARRSCWVSCEEQINF